MPAFSVSWYIFMNMPIIFLTSLKMEIDKLLKKKVQQLLNKLLIYTHWLLSQAQLFCRKNSNSNFLSIVKDVNNNIGTCFKSDRPLIRMLLQKEFQPTVILLSHSKRYSSSPEKHRLSSRAINYKKNYEHKTRVIDLQEPTALFCLHSTKLKWTRKTKNTAD